MSLSLIDPCKKRKRNHKLFSFNSFGDPGSPFTPSGTFRENIPLFLEECGELNEDTVLGNPLWCTLLVDIKANFRVSLYTLEEDVYQSSHPFCDYCRSFGWSRHFVTKRTYHFIIPMDSERHKPLDDGALDNQSHLLHGVIHCNGCGHLVCINGCEGGSKVLKGRAIMDLWDRICTNLKARRVSVEDVSRKRSMDLRLLHGVAYEHSWFGSWGYRFCPGSFGVTDTDYSEAIAYLGSLEIDEIARDLSKTECHKEVEQMVRCYRDMNMSETQITTISDLLRFMLTAKPRAPVTKTNYVPSSAFNSRNPTRQTLSNRTNMKDKSQRYKKFNTIVANMGSRWPKRRLDDAAKVIVDILNEHKGVNAMTRQEVRDAAKLHIGNTGLLDHVLKSLNDVIVGNYVVHRMANPMTKTYEYTIHEHGDGIKDLKMEPEVMAHLDPKEESSRMPRNDVNSDVLCVYKNVLLGYPDSEKVELAVKTILDSRHFVKDFATMDEMEQQVLTFICKLKPTVAEINYELTEPGHDVTVTVPLHATVGDLKKAAEAALRDTYCIAERVTVTGFAELMGVSDEEVLFGRIEPGGELCVRGTDFDLHTIFKYQGEEHNLKVRCECGAQDDTGERMVACHICNVWQHTRCYGIEDSETVPSLFTCDGCWNSLKPKSFE